MRGKYDQTVDKGDERVRCKRLEITNPLVGNPVVTIWEEIVSLRADGTEKSVEDLPFFRVEITQQELEELFPLKSPVDDSLLGIDSNGNGAMINLYGWTRKIQLKRDAALAVVAQEEQEELP